MKCRESLLGNAMGNINFYGALLCICVPLAAEPTWWWKRRSAALAVLVCCSCAAG